MYPIEGYIKVTMTIPHEILKTGVQPLTWDDLNESQRLDHDFLESEDDRYSASFIPYGDMVFCTAEILRSDSNEYDGVYGVSNTSAFTFTYDHDDDTWTIGYIG